MYVETVHVVANHITTTGPLLASRQHHIVGAGITDFIPITPIFTLLEPLAKPIRLLYGSMMAIGVVLAFWALLLNTTKLGVAGKNEKKFESAVHGLRNGAGSAIGMLIVAPVFLLAYVFAALFATYIK